MITYELAKKLKNAGFPQNIDYGNSFYEEGEEVASPSLSELIEVCGNKFSNLERGTNGYWKVQNNNEPFIRCINSTPEEAVANLWLELNK